MLKKTINRQVNQIFKTLLTALHNAPDSEFHYPVEDFHACVGGMAMHIAGSIEGAFATEAWYAKWSTPVSSKPACIACLEACKDDLLKPFIENAELLTADEQPEYFISKLDRVLKILRHVCHHTGELNTRLNAIAALPGSFV
ncbi:MAG: hypothetical protein PF961_08265 [Planctomycetota bacterium]|jgi:hypothetical protein|nr:hypothetical protein [Planctomycetota bacterium]